MAEKKGNIDKIQYDFNTSGNLEVFLPKIGWRRVTPQDFRSFDGDRRITEPIKIVKGNVNISMETYKYHGGVYYWGTNKEVPFSNSSTIINSPMRLELQKISENRR